MTATIDSPFKFPWVIYTYSFWVVIQVAIGEDQIDISDDLRGIVITLSQ